MAGNEQDFFDDFLAAALDILRLGVKEKNKVLARLGRLQRELIGRLSETDLSSAKRAEADQLIRDASQGISERFKEIADVTDLGDISLYSAEETRGILKIYFGKPAVLMPKQAYFESVKSNVLIQGAPSSAWWKAQADDTAFKFAAQVRLGLISGETNQQIVQRIVGKSGSPGVMDTTRRNAASLVQTSVQTVANDARRKTFQENDGLVKGVRQVSTLDSHTSLVCMAYSGAEWDLDFKPIGKNKLPYKGGTPRHFSCRSLEVPITKTFRELGIDVDEAPVGTRASDEGQISADTTFDSFLKRKSKSYLDEKLGEGRAELFRSGKITLRDLVNGEGNPVSLEQLRKLARSRGRG